MKILTTALLSSVILTGCASIISDSNYPVSIKSTPEGAKFIVKDEKGVTVHSGTTPFIVNLDAGDGFFSKAEYTVEFENNGNKSTVQVKPTLDGWYIGNLLFGGLLGLLIVDPLTGAMYKLPEEVNTSLDKQAFLNNSDMLTVVTLNEISAEDRARLIPLN